MQKSTQKPKKKPFWRPNRLLYALAKAVLAPYFRIRYRLRIDHAYPPVSPPYVVIANHASSLDFLIMALAVKKHRVSIVTATVFFYNPFLRILLGWMGCIPKLQMVPDPASIRHMLAAVRQGAVLGLFPHGQVCHSGKGLPLPPGTGKLLQHMNVPVLNIQIHGAGLTKPKWAYQKRRGSIEAKIELLLTPEQLSTMSTGEVEETVQKAISFNDYEYNRTVRVKFQRKAQAEGLERILYRCPRCHALYRMRTQGNNIVCEACGNGAVMDECGQLHPLHPGDTVFEDPAQWTDFERAMEKAELTEKGELKQEADLWIGDGKHFRFSNCGHGWVVLTRDAFRFEGTRDGQPFSVGIPVSQIAGLPVSIRKSYWELPGQDVYYRFLPDRRESLMRLVLGMEAAREMQSES